MYMDIRLKELCQLRGITQKELASKLEVTEMTLSRASKGNTSMQLLEKIATALNVELWDGKDYYNATTIAELEKIVAEIKEKSK